MAYLLCFAALLMNTVKGYCGKKTSGMISSFSGTVLFSAARMLLCIPIGLLLILLRSGTLSADRTLLVTAAVSGIASAVFTVSWLSSVRCGSYMMVDVFLTLGVAFPLVACRIVYKEPLLWTHITGLILLASAAYIMSSYNTSIGKSKLKPSSVLLLAVCGLSNGVISFCQKRFTYECQGDGCTYNFYSYVFASAALLIFWFFLNGFGKNKTTKPHNGNRISVSELSVYLFAMSLCLFLNSLFLTMASASIPAAQLYPFIQGCNLILSMLMSSVFFHETITKKCVLGSMMTFAALLLINNG
ncbi:MAG: EamA family transporter [Eubacteriales bacterium]